MNCPDCGLHDLPYSFDHHWCPFCGYTEPRHEVCT